MPREPEGPLAVEGRPRAVRARLWALALLVPSLLVLAVAARLTPDRRGYGTHEALGLGRCGMLIATGLPCPTCGMTTAFSHAVRGQLIRAFWAQPSGLAMALATIVLAGASVWTLVRGAPPRVDLPQVTPYRLFLAFLVIFVAGWAFKLALGLLTGELPVRP